MSEATLTTTTSTTERVAFQRDDLVRVLESEYGIFDTGKLYRVKSADRLHAIIDGEHPGGWCHERFELVYRPGEPTTWKPKVGDPVKCKADGNIGHERGKVYNVVEGSDTFNQGLVWLSTDRNDMNAKPHSWISRFDIVPISHAEAEAMTPKVEPVTTPEDSPVTTPAEDPEAVKLKGEVEDLRRRLSLMTEDRDLHQRNLINFQETVREAVIREAEAREWCDEADSWLEELGLEGRKSKDYGLPRNRYSVVRLTNHRVAILEDTDYDDSPWRIYPGGDWASYETIYSDYLETLFVPDDTDDIFDL